MSKNKIVAIVGMPGSGKSEASKVFINAGWTRIYFGQVTMDELERRGLERTQANERLVREELRAEYGKDAFAKLLTPSIEAALEKSDVILDGLYSWSEYKLLRQKFGGLKLLALVPDKKLRHERIGSRPDRRLGEAEAEERDFAEIENLEKGGPIAAADYFINNNGETELLYARVARIIEDLDKE